MRNHELDELLRAKLNQPTPPPAGLWERIEARLDEQGVQPILAPRPKPKYWTMAASVAALVTAVGASVYFYNQHNEVQPSSSDIVHQTNTASNPTHNSTLEEPVQHTPSSQQNNSSVTSTSKIGNHINSHASALDEPITPSTQNTIDFLAIEYLDAAPQLQLEQFKPAPVVPAQHLNWNVVLEEDNEQKTLERNEALVKREEKFTFNLDPLSITEVSRIYYGMSGAYHFGSLKSGGALTFNTRKDINERVFIEGNIGLVVNNSTPYQANFKGDFIDFKNRPQTFASATTNLYTNSDAFYFVQLNPTVGVNVHKRLDLALGPDFQHMVTNNGFDVVMFQQSKLLPKNDLGVTGKAEFGVTENLKAGVLYREGLTPIITNNNFISSRRYLQVMMKLQILKTKEKKVRTKN